MNWKESHRKRKKTAAKPGSPRGDRIREDGQSKAMMSSQARKEKQIMKDMNEENERYDRISLLNCRGQGLAS